MPSVQATANVKIFSLPVRVYYQDTDAGKVVFYGNYLSFMERARVEWLRSLSVDAQALTDLGILFVVRAVKIDYLRPALLDDLLDVTVNVTELGKSRASLQQNVTREQTLLAQAMVDIVCVSAETFKPTSIPNELRAKFLIGINE